MKYVIFATLKNCEVIKPELGLRNPWTNLGKIWRLSSLSPRVEYVGCRKGVWVRWGGEMGEVVLSRRAIHTKMCFGDVPLGVIFMR